MRIQYTQPSITELEVAYVTDAARYGWGSECYAYIHRFEDAFRQHLGVAQALATSSATGALHMGLAALGIGPGDEVILADTNWIASVAPILYLGATPVLVDIRPDTWCLDPVRVAEAITARTKAIIAVHLYGNLCELDALLALGRQHGIAVVEDAAEALGSVYHGQRAGSLGTFGVFSFHGTKTMTTGEGGMFVTQDAALLEKVATLANHGRAAVQSRQFWPETLGFKYKLSNIQAALGCAQVERLDELTQRKRQILSAYKARLADLGGLAFNPERPGEINGAWMPTLVFDPALGITRECLLETFAAADIDARVFFHPLSSLPPFGRREPQPIAKDIAGRAINLPSFHDITEAQLDRVCQVVRNLHARSAS